jgi:hypothetical protein
MHRAVDAVDFAAQIGKGGRGGFGHGNALSGKATLLSAPAAPWQSRLHNPALTAARRRGIARVRFSERLDRQDK